MERKTLLPVLVLAALSALFAAEALLSPVKSIPKPTTTNAALGADYDSAVYANLLPLWYYQSYAELAEAFAVSTALLVLTVWVFSHIHTSTRRPNRLLKWVGLSMAAAGGVAWVAFALSSWLYPNLRYFGDYTLGSPTYVAREAGALVVNSGPASFAQLSTLLVGTCGAFLLTADRGWRRALLDSLLLYAAPLSLFYEIGLLHFLPLAMTDHVMNFLRLYEGGVQPVSNWLVLVVAALLTVSGLWESKKRLADLRRRTGVASSIPSEGSVPTPHGPSAAGREASA